MSAFLRKGNKCSGSTGVYLAQKRVQWKVRALPHYKESLVIVRDHPKATVGFLIKFLKEKYFMLISECLGSPYRGWNYRHFGPTTQLCGQDEELCE